MSSGQPLEALVVQHEQPTPGGYVHMWLEDRGAEQDVYRIDIEDREVGAADYDLIVSLGSEFAVFDDSIRWLERRPTSSAAASGSSSTPRSRRRSWTRG